MLGIPPMHHSFVRPPSTHTLTHTAVCSLTLASAPMYCTAPQVLGLTEELLGAIAAGDWATYERLCAADMTCFEPEARGHLVKGLVRAMLLGAE